MDPYNYPGPPAPASSRPPAPPTYAQWFLDGEGIEHRVVQSDIPRYLGNDATVRRGHGPDNRSGYIYCAYRPLTGFMIQSLKDDSERYNYERRENRHYNHRDLGYHESQTFHQSQQRPQPPLPPIVRPQELPTHTAQLSGSQRVEPPAQPASYSQQPYPPPSQAYPHASGQNYPHAPPPGYRPGPAYGPSGYPEPDYRGGGRGREDTFYRAVPSEQYRPDPRGDGYQPDPSVRQSQPRFTGSGDEHIPVPPGTDPQTSGDPQGRYSPPEDAPPPPGRGYYPLDPTQQHQFRRYPGDS